MLITILQKIREQIETGHWTKNIFDNGLGKHCIVGLWNRTDGHEFYSVWNVLGEDVMEINDDPGTTTEDMLVIVDRAIAKQKE